MKLKLTKKEIHTKAMNVLIVILGTIVLAFGCAIFLIPFDLVTGGVSGIAIVLDKLLPFQSVMTIEIYVAILSWALFIIGWIILGKSFAAKTLISTIVYPVALWLFGLLRNPNILGGFFMIETAGDYLGMSLSNLSILIAAIFGGAFVGAGVAITFIGGGSSGGVDVIALTINHFFKKTKMSHLTFLVDAAIILCGMFVIQNFVVSLLGIMSAFVAAIVLDKLFLGESKAFVCQVVSDKYEEINDAVINQLDRTTTIVHVTGGYSKEEKKMLFISFTLPQYTELLRIITSIDKEAFLTIHRAHEINGEGFSRPSPTANENIKK